MLDAPPARRQFPYYGSYAGFYRALRELKEKGLPRRIETRFFGPVLKNEATRVVAGFASLGWTNDVGRPSDDLGKIVDAFSTDKWITTLATVVPKAYPYLEKLDLETASARDLRDAFVNYVGRDAETLRNAETFFLCLSYESQRPMSEAFVRRAERGAGDARRWLKLAESGIFDTDATDENNDTHEKEAPRHSVTAAAASTEAAADRIIELNSWFSNDMTEKEMDAIRVLTAYFARKHKQRK